ncbi:hypothetical protein [uncultured Fibrobacter sp.]|uniref:hypothetical protein n=1 Tax=uncultured Fibrobacter sp. TaxID=261512 RepID=UPI0025E0AF9F|nr:hypothetical protein [uncultured Fibrobacter sp.]
MALCLVACSDDSVAINDAIVAISSSSETFNESSSEMSGNSVVSSSDALSSENLISSSSEVEATSSTAVSSSSVSRFEGIVFRNGDKKTAVQKSDIDSVKTQAAGRFWLVMRDPLNQKETESLENIGIYRQRCYEGYRYYLYDYNGPSRDDLGYMCLCLMKAEKDVQKSAIDSRINEFYNSFDADETVAEGIVWESRDQKTVVKRFGDDSLMTQAAGRFWLITDYSLNKEARASLEAFGVETLSCSALHTESLDMGICFMKGARDIQKATMDSLIVGFYNTFNVDDTTKLEFDYTGAHWVVEDVSLEIVVGCWEDVPMDACKEIVKTCKGEDAALDRSVILSTATRETIDCLLSNKDVNRVEPVRYGEPTVID